MSVIYDRVALIGLGLIASSMAHGIRREGLAREIVGYSTGLGERPPRYWELEIEGNAPGVDYKAGFLVPVYAHA